MRLSKVHHFSVAWPDARHDDDSEVVREFSDHRQFLVGGKCGDPLSALIELTAAWRLLSWLSASVRTSAFSRWSTLCFCVRSPARSRITWSRCSRATTPSGRPRVSPAGVGADDDRYERLQVKSFGGAVALEGVESRRVEVETVSGSVTFDGALAADGRYELRSHSGGIVLTVPGGSGFELDAQSFNGDLRSDIPILVGRGDPSRHTPVFEGGRRAIRGIAAAGGARPKLSTVSGDMAIAIRASNMLQPAASRPSGIH